MVGEYEYPEHRWNGAIDWELGDGSASTTLSFIGEFEDTSDVNYDDDLYGYASTVHNPRGSYLYGKVNYSF